MTASSPDLIVTAANGVAWRRLPGGTSSAAELLTALAMWTDSGGKDHPRVELVAGRPTRSREDRILDVIRQWDHAAPPPSGYRQELETAFSNGKLTSSPQSRVA
jgi:hypothetical protein